MNALERLSQSQALWNRERLDLRSNEILAQILDRGSLDDWRALYRLAKDGEGDVLLAADLRQRLREVLKTVPVPLPHFWLAALESLSDSGALLEPTPAFPAYPAEAEL
jgi:hypothetical protein